MSTMDYTQQDSTNIRGYYAWTDTLKGVYCTLAVLAVLFCPIDCAQMDLDVWRQRSRSYWRHSGPNARLS